jgi:hypothetical protein
MDTPLPRLSSDNIPSCLSDFSLADELGWFIEPEFNFYPRIQIFLVTFEDSLG